MLESGIANIAMFFVFLGLCLAFVIMWVIKSESKTNFFKNEVRKLRSRVGTSERERFLLEEKVEGIGGAAGVGLLASSGGPEDLAEELARKNEDLGNENTKLKNELGDAKNSLEEVYKALLSDKG